MASPRSRPSHDLLGHAEDVRGCREQWQLDRLAPDSPKLAHERTVYDSRYAKDHRALDSSPSSSNVPAHFSPLPRVLQPPQEPTPVSQSISERGKDSPARSSAMGSSASLAAGPEDEVICPHDIEYALLVTSPIRKPGDRHASAHQRASATR